VSDNKFIDIVFDGPPGHDAGRFVEVEDADGCSIAIGEWVEREGGLWALRISDRNPITAEERDALAHAHVLVNAADCGDVADEPKRQRALAVIDKLIAGAKP
jgi:hypothetical protein